MPTEPYVYHGVPTQMLGETLYPLRDLVRLEPSSYRELEVLPSATLRWYERLSREKKRGAWFVGVPHVLVRGPVSTAGLVPLDWSLPRPGLTELPDGAS